MTDHSDLQDVDLLVLVQEEAQKAGVTDEAIAFLQASTAETKVTGCNADDIKALRSAAGTWLTRNSAPRATTQTQLLRVSNTGQQKNPRIGHTCAPPNHGRRSGGEAELNATQRAMHTAGQNPTNLLVKALRRICLEAEQSRKKSKKRKEREEETKRMASLEVDIPAEAPPAEAPDAQVEGPVVQMEITPAIPVPQGNAAGKQPAEAADGAPAAPPRDRTGIPPAPSKQAPTRPVASSSKRTTGPRPAPPRKNQKSLPLNQEDLQKACLKGNGKLSSALGW